MLLQYKSHVLLLLSTIISCYGNKLDNPTFQGYEFFFENQTSNFTEAEWKCEDINATLVYIFDNSTQSFIELELQQTSDNSSSTDVYYWVGAESKNNTWQWLDGTVVPCSDSVDVHSCNDTYFNWAADRPKAGNNKAMALNVSSETLYFGDWVDVEKSQRNRFICFREICSGIVCPGKKVCVSNTTEYECVCPEGTKPPNCSLACDSNPCKNNSTCNEAVDGFTCVCPQNYSGSSCEYICWSKPCKNGGECFEDGEEFNCTCPKNYSGRFCEIYMNICDDESCVHGTCQNDTCECAEDYTGQNCTEKESEEFATWKIIVIAVCGGVALIAIVTALLVYIHRRKSKNQQQPKSQDIPLRGGNQYVPNPRHIPDGHSETQQTPEWDNDDDDYETDLPQQQLTINADNLLEKCCAMQQNNNAVFEAQFRNLKAVVASTKGERHYVNASYHHGELCTFIRIQLHTDTNPTSALKFGVYQVLSMQTPQAHQASKFWETLHSEGCPILVSLGNDAQYVPQNDAACVYGKMRVQTTGQEHKKHYVVTTYEIEETGTAYTTSCKHLTEYRWTEPGDINQVLTHPGFHRFVADLRSTTNKSRPPCTMLVHSNEGMSEHSCFIAYFALLQQLKVSKTLEIFNTVMEFRVQCDIFVEKLEDYILLHKLLAEYHTLENSDQVDKQFIFKIKVLERTTDGRSGFDTELLKLSKLQSLNIVSNYQLQEESKYIQFQVDGQVKSFYVRGCAFQNVAQFPTALTTSAPTWDNLTDFWQFVFVYRATNIVMLTQLVERDTVQSIKYWPDVGKLGFHRGLKVKLESETQHSDYIVKRVLSVSSGRSRVSVTHWQYTGWPSNLAPDEFRDLKELISQLEQNSQPNEDTLLVHSGVDMNRAGNFISLLTLLHRKRTEGMINVMRTVHNTRKQIPTVAASQEQYSFLYHMMTT